MLCFALSGLVSPVTLFLYILLANRTYARRVLNVSRLCVLDRLLDLLTDEALCYVSVQGKSLISRPSVHGLFVFSICLNLITMYTLACDRECSQSGSTKSHFSQFHCKVRDFRFCVLQYSLIGITAGTFSGS